MDYIERPKKATRSEQNVQTNEYIQKNMQKQLDNIYDFLDKIVDELNQ